MNNFHVPAPVVSSNNVPTIPISVAQAMNPGPQPPSAAARATTQKALRRENPNLLSSRDAQILMGLRDKDDHKHNALSSISSATPNAGKTPQPSRVVSKGPLHGRVDIIYLSAVSLIDINFLDGFWRRYCVGEYPSTSAASNF